ncbi:class I SAM-dependent methyltransferase [Mucilaginibacter robiniae]|uniref:Class I SAM-dependent methyltransferase n=1 Tax=Mucilaginibacter robiniae TaxID=2728022 RepID=A0A7L5ECD0_9SPHI|nr:class I SAM-dependent methyltransferase [Mucilaginibacter robiniae]QJD98056.1 class I SAM-dependent methyltransferase [Mucilaginibacter robiniae]
MSDVLGKALYDYQFQNSPGKLWINNRYGERELMDLAIYFRNEDDMTDLEWLAMNECRGKVLDIGAAAGSHALELQTRGYDVTALDISPLAINVMQARGVHKVQQADIFTYSGTTYDTLLLLMNGIGLAGTLKDLPALLLHMKSLLEPGGQLLFDSSDVTYLYDGNLPANQVYYGEIAYQYQYKQQKSNWFNWLYVDEQSLLEVANEAGFATEVLYEDEYQQYLVRLTTI